MLTCRSGGDDVDALRFKLSPLRVSSEEGWRLFDRSIETGATPSGPIAVTLERAQRVAAVKVYGPAGYQLDIVAPGVELGFSSIDLSRLSKGWHTFTAATPEGTSTVELRFAPLGGGGAVPEVELWGETDGLGGRAAAVDIAGPLPEGWVTTAASPKLEIAPSRCETVAAEQVYRPELLRRAYLVYRASGVLRGFGIARAINGGARQGGAWLAGGGERVVVEEIDPAILRAGPNEISLCVPGEALERVAVEGVRIVGELDRGVDLAVVANAALVDGDLATDVALAAGETLSIGFERWIAPEVVVLGGDVHGDVAIDCLDRSGGATRLRGELRESAFVVDGGGLACAALVVRFSEAVTLSEVDVVGSGARERVDWPRAVVTSRREHFGDVAWIGGFVARPRAMTTAIRVTVDGEAVESTTGDFGRLVTRRDAAKPWRVPVTAAFPDRTSWTTEIALDDDRSADRQTGGSGASSGKGGGASSPPSGKFAAGVGEESDEVVVRATPAAGAQVRLGTRVGVVVPPGAVTAATDITVRHLGDIVIPPMDPGMINVSAPRGHGYEYLPHGQTFERPVEVTLPYDPALIPDGKTAADVNAYYYDTDARRWVKLTRQAVDIGELTTRSTTTHFTTMVNAVLVVPKSPTPLAFDPTALGAIPAASPAANIDVIEPPQPSSTGDAQLGLPIRIPAGRGAYAPSVGISYASGQGSGWLGVGWDLRSSRIEIDTRWGVPTYAATEEPRYVLDGAELVPTAETDGPSCVSPGAQRRYRTRIEGGFAHILRCGDDPSRYVFEVRDRDGTRYVYGTGDSALASYADSGGVFRWALREVIDRNGNTTRYRYHLDDVAAADAEPYRELYPRTIEYTSHASLPNAPYTVEFELDNAARPDAVVSGRAGFKTVTRHLLRAVHVKFQAEIVRSYVLTYQHGQFDKSILSSIRVFGLGGCAASGDAFATPTCTAPLFHEHRFDYFREDEKFGQPEGWEISNPNATLTQLGQGVTKGLSLTGSVHAGGDDFGGQISGNVSFSGRDEIVGMYDMNGDGLVDQLYDLGGNGGVVARNNQSRPGVPASGLMFAQAGGQPEGLPSLVKEESLSWGVRASGNGGSDGAGANLSAGYNSGLTQAKRSLSDLNGDGFVDLATTSGIVLLGKPCAAGICFAAEPYGAMRGIDPTKDPILQGISFDIKQRLVNGDPVVQWTAPFDGTIELTGTVRKPLAGGADGVTIELYRPDSDPSDPDERIASLHLEPDDTSEHVFPAATTVDVGAGESLWLRVTTGDDDGVANDGTLRDQVTTRLTIAYTTACAAQGCTSITDPFAAREPTGAPVFAFDSQQDFRVAGMPTLAVAPVRGTLQVRAQLEKQATLADLRACVQRISSDAEQEDIDQPCSTANDDVANISGTLPLPAGSTTPLALTLSQPLDPGESLIVRVESDLSFDPSAVKLVPQSADVPLIAYSEVCLPDDNGDPGPCSTAPADIDSVVIGTAQLGAYVKIPEQPPAVPLVAAADGTWEVEPFAAPDEPFVWAVRTDRHGIVLIQDCTAVSCGSTLTTPPFPVTAGESVSFELVTASGDGPTEIDVSIDGNSSVVAPLNVRQLAPGPRAIVHSPFVGGYRGFFAGFWNEKIGFEPTRFIDDISNASTLSALRKRQIRLSTPNPVPSLTGTTITGKEPAWIAPGSAAFVSATTLSAAKLGALGNPESAADGGGVFQAGYVRVSATSSFFLGIGAELVDVPGFSFDITGGASSTTTTTDLVDVNGDGVVDVVKPGKFVRGKFSDDIEGGGETEFTLAGAAVRKREGRDYSIGFGANAVVRRTTSSGRTAGLDNDEGADRGQGFAAGTGVGLGRSQTTTDLIDLNGDGLPDSVRRDNTTVLVRYNLGNRFGVEEPFGQLAAAMTEPIDLFESTIERGVPLPSGSLDSTRNALQHDTTLSESITKGFKFKIFGYGVDFSITKRKASTATTRQLADINGDGLPDLLFKRNQDSFLRVQLNRGGDFGPPITWPTTPWPIQPGQIFVGATLAKINELAITGPDVLAGTGVVEGVTHHGSLSADIYAGVWGVGIGGSKNFDRDAYELALLDIDGDGSADHVLRRETPEPDDRKIFVKRNQVTGRANLLRRVSRPLGGAITLDYARTQNTLALPHSRQVLSRVEIDDGVDLGAAFASPNIVSAVTYENGAYDRNEKELFGFGIVRETRADGVIVESEYDVASYALHGRLLRQTRRDASGGLLSERRASYETQPVLGADGLPVGAHPACLDNLHPLLTEDACTPQFPVLVRDDDVRAEGGTLAKTRITSDLSRDRFGNVLASLDQGDDAIADDDLHSAATYSNDTARWILGRPTSLTVRAGSEAGTVVRQRSGTYNTNGDVETISIATGAGTATTQLTYDAFGNLATTRSPPNHAGQVQTVAITYEPTTRSYPATVTNGFGLTSLASYDLRFGVATSETDTNGTQFTRTLDAFGRLATVRTPYDTGQPALTLSYFPSASPPRAVTVTRAAAPADYTGPIPTPVTRVIAIDGFGQPLEQRATTVVNNVPGMTTSGVVSRDAVGRVVRTFHPFFTPGASTDFVPPITTLATDIAYDTQDRTISTTFPDGAIEGTSYALAPQLGTLLFHTRTTDANNHVRDLFRDHLDRTRTFIEHPTVNASAITNYSYLATGELSSIVDAEGHTTTVGYDLRGMRTSLDNADTGRIEHRYDLMGNSIALIEPNHRALGVEVRYAYDRDRLVTVDYPSKPDVTYVYGAAGAANFRAGRIERILDETGTQELFYGALGETRRLLRTVDPHVPLRPSVPFDLRMTSDTLGRQLRLIYPDGEVLTNTYNAAGQLSAVTGAGSNWSRTYASNLIYDVFGNRTSMQFANGVITTAEFEPARVRLATLKTALPQNRGNAQDLHYTYDPGGNPTTITNTVSVPGLLDLAAPGPSSLTFTYDGVDRLKRATGTATLGSGSSTAYDQNFTYSASHNLVTKNRVHSNTRVVLGINITTHPAATNFAFNYTYEGRPHLPAAIGGVIVTYDASGNATRRRRNLLDDEQLTWDDDGRLTDFTKLGVAQRNVYDATGLRVIRRSGLSETIFSSPYFDLENVLLGTKHIFAGDTRVASVQGNITLVGTPLPLPLPAQPGIPYYFHPDHLGSTGVLTNHAGHIEQSLEYFPDGESWIDRGLIKPSGGFLFSGKQLDPDTGLYDFGQRFYDPRTSLWLGIDPAFTDNAGTAVGTPMYLALSAYASQNPIAFIDPDGRRPHRPDNTGDSSRRRQQERCLTHGYCSAGDWQRYYGGEQETGLVDLVEAVASNIGFYGKLCDTPGGCDDNGTSSYDNNSADPPDVPDFPDVPDLPTRGGPGKKQQGKAKAGTGTGSGTGTSGSGGVGTDTAASKAKELSREARKGIRRLELRIAQHEKKLADFKANPTVRPGMEGQPREIIEAAQRSRIRHLETEIQTFRNNIEKLKAGQ